MSRTMDAVVVVAAVVVTPVVLALGVNQPRVAEVHVNPAVIVADLAEAGHHVQHAHDVIAAYMRGMDDGVADYCQEIGGDGSDHGTCVLP